ncbi:hypothetical protein EDD15DRAFT_2181422, partial [Pisolithus albus]
LSQRFQELLTVFGFNWHVAPGEAEAELACLQSLGLIDAVATPYNDALLFSATCIIRSAPNIGRYEDVYIYTPDAIEKDASLEWGDLLLVMLMSGADNNANGSWCSVEVARRLAYYGFGRSLLEAAISFPFVEFMDFVTKWRDDVCEVLKTDPRRLLGGKHHEVAHIIKEERTEFPDPTVLAMYLLPLTSWLDGRSPAITTTSRQPDLHSLAMFCLQCLSWSPSIIQSELMDALAGTAMRALLQVSYTFIQKILSDHLFLTTYSYQATSTAGSCDMAFGSRAILMTGCCPCTRSLFQLSSSHCRWMWTHRLMCICHYWVRTVQLTYSMNWRSRPSYWNTRGWI